MSLKTWLYLVSYFVRQLKDSTFEIVRSSANISEGKCLFSGIKTVKLLVHYFYAKKNLAGFYHLHK